MSIFFKRMRILRIEWFFCVFFKKAIENYSFCVTMKKSKKGTCLHQKQRRQNE